MKKLLLAALAAIALLAVILLVRASGLPSRQVPPGTAASIDLDPDAAAVRLAGAIRFPTISWGDAATRDEPAFAGLERYLDEQFPRVHQTLTREIVAGHSLLYTWPGSRADRSPVILTAHLDVVPVDRESEPRWTHPPFEGVVADGSVWGRGAIDDKSGVLGLLEAVEALLARGVAPERTVYLAFGHNEEGGGDESGARAIAATLAARGVRGGWLMDEGGLIYDHVPGVSHPVALVGIAEKPALGVELVVNAPGGHASMPPPETAVGILARAVDAVERHPMPARIDGAALGMFDALAPEMNWPMRAAFANLWLIRPLVLRRLESRPDTNAVVRTTMAPTVVEGSPKDNVLAATARAVFNVRLLPGDTPAGVEAHVRRVIGDARVNVRLHAGATPPAAPSAIDTPEFASLARAIRAVYPDVFVAPYLTMVATDAREYAAVAPNTYRFLPIHQDGALESIHGIDEHVRVDAYARAIRVYATIVMELATR